MFTLITGMPLFIKKLAQDHCDKNNVTICLYSKTYVKRPLSKRPKIGSQDQLSLRGRILQCFWPSLSYNLSLRSLFFLFLSSRFTQDLLYME